jgi:tetratricopeptide (TPR) repeat protein
VPETEEDEPPAEEALPSDDTAPRNGTLETCAKDLRAQADPVASAAETEAYLQAHAIEQREELPAARKAYFDIIANMPKSPYVPAVYLAFAELFARESASDPSKWELARSAYNEVVKYPPPQNRVYAYALLRNAEIDRVKEDPAQALASFKRVFEAITQYPDTRCAAQLGDAAEQGMIQAYADAGAPEKAWMFFRHVSPKRGESLFAGVVDELMRRGRTKEACAAAHQGEGAAAEQAKAKACKP